MSGINLYEAAARFDEEQVRPAYLAMHQIAKTGAIAGVTCGCQLVLLGVNGKAVKDDYDFLPIKKGDKLLFCLASQKDLLSKDKYENMRGIMIAILVGFQFGLSIVQNWKLG